MKKIILFSVLLSFLAFGCGGDDDDAGTDPVDTTPTITANTSVASPSLDNPNDAVWNSVTMTTIPISASRPKMAVPKATAVSASVRVQSIKNNDTLFFRIKWNDDDFSVWRNFYEITEVGPPITFSTADPLEDEDHLYIMFDGGQEFGWDVWNWRSLTTAPGNLAEGYRYINNILMIDAGSATVAYKNEDAFPGLLRYVHIDTSDFNGYIMYDTDKLYRLDTNLFGNPVTQTGGWTLGQRIPGYTIDSTLDDYSSYAENRRNSRFDIRSKSTYNESTDEYTVVLSCKLNTEKADDIDLSLLNSVTIRIGIFNNIPGYDNSFFSEGNTDKGFTGNINLVLPE